jgi:hypothetical protein
MKKVLVATCVVAVTAFGITNASSSPAQTTRASAFGLELKSSLLSGTTGGGGSDALIERTGEAESTLPPGGPMEDDIATVGSTGELALSGTGKVLADTRVESTIRPILNPENEEERGGEGAGSGLLGGEDLIGGLIGGGDEGTVGGLVGGGGGIVSNSEGEAGTVRAQQVGGLVGGGDDEGFLGGLTEGILGDSEDDEEGNTDPDIQVAFANAQGYAVVENLGVANEDLADNLVGLGLTEVASEALADALLKVEAVQAEAVVVCDGTIPRFDTASRLVDLNNDPLAIVDDLVQTVAEILPGVIEVNETGRTADGGVFVNALHVTVGGDLLEMDEEEETTTDPSIPEVTVTTLGVGNFQVQQADDDEDALIDLIVGHAEVGGTVCAQQAAPPAPLVPAGDDRTLPVTGGGLGVLPAVLSLGLAGGALAAGRVALRSRRGNSL